MLKKDSLVKFIRIAASVKETRRVYKSIHNTSHWKLTPKLATAIRYLIYKHSTFLRHTIIRALPNAAMLPWS